MKLVANVCVPARPDEAATLVGINFLVGYVTHRNKKLEALVEGRPEVLIHNGKVFEKVMNRVQLTHHELMAAIRQGGCACIDDVHLAVIENNGSISVVPRQPGAREGDLQPPQG